MRVLFFSPNSGIWINKSREAVLAKGLLTNNIQIEYLFCNGLYNSFCITMHASGLNGNSAKEEKKNVCAACMRRRDDIKRYLSCHHSCVDDYLTESKHIEIQSVVDDIDESNYIDYQIDDIHIGKYASYEVLINNKKRSFDFTGIEWNEYQAAFNNCIKTYYLLQDYFSGELKPDVIFIQNGLYSINWLTIQIAKKYNISTYIYDNNPNISNQYGGFLFSKDSPFVFYDELSKKEWYRIKDNPLSIRQTRNVAKYIRTLLGSSNHYAFSSSRKGDFDARDFFTINTNQKIILVATSSYDELFSANAIGAKKGFDTEKIIFPNLEQWLKSIIDWSANNNDFFCIIRIHPREAKLISGTSHSENLKKLRRNLVELPPNVAINWPEDNISIYDLYDSVDLVLSAWSSVGIEASLFQIPVLLYTNKIISYPENFNLVVGDSTSNYFSSIRTLLDKGNTIENTIKVFRWYNLLFSGSVIKTRKKRMKVFIYRIYNLKIMGKKPIKKLISYTPFVIESLNINDYFISKKDISNVVKTISDDRILLEYNRKSRKNRIIEKLLIIYYMKYIFKVNVKRLSYRTDKYKVL